MFALNEANTLLRTANLTGPVFLPKSENRALRRADDDAAAIGEDPTTARSFRENLGGGTFVEVEFREFGELATLPTQRPALLDVD